jgi:hypothetical protein
MKFALSSLALSFALLVPALASAQELGNKGDVVFSAERMMGIVGTKRSVETNLGDLNNDWTSISFGWRATPETSPFDVPRLGFDYLVIDHLSLGGSLGYLSLDPDDGGELSAFIFAPRIGYLYSFGRVVGIWPRGGFSYHTLSVEGGGRFEERGFALNLECPFTFSPASHFAFHVGPTFDIDMFGSRTVHPGNVEVKGDLTYRAFGVNAGLLGWF